MSKPTKIIAGRPYLSKADLATKDVIPTGVYLSLKGRIIAIQKQRPKSKASAAARQLTDRIDEHHRTGRSALLCRCSAVGVHRPHAAAAGGVGAPASTAASRTRRTARPGHGVQREGCRHLPELPRRRSRHRDLHDRGDLQDPARAPRQRSMRRSAPAACSARPATGPAPSTPAKGSNKKQTINSFKANSFLSVNERNAACLDCHQNQARTGWHAGAHERGALACTDCHKLHAERDAVLTKADQADVCFSCHKKQRADFQKTSTHPVRFGLMRCSDCHSPHGSSEHGDADQADAEPDLLHLPRRKARAAVVGARAGGRRLLAVPHRATARCAARCSTRARRCCASNATARPAIRRWRAPGPRCPAAMRGGSIFLLAGSCTNCHSQVHGSNHPAGAKLMR